MKTSRVLSLIVLALGLGFLAARLTFAQPATPPPAYEPATDNVALEELQSFVKYLQDTKQTNTLERFSRYSNASIMLQNSADLGVALVIMQRLRDGRTNDVVELLEGRIDSYIIGLAASYRELPVSIREKTSLKTLQRARDYRVKFPFKHRYANVDEGVADAFKILDEKPVK